MIHAATALALVAGGDLIRTLASSVDNSKWRRMIIVVGLGLSWSAVVWASTALGSRFLWTIACLVLALAWSLCVRVRPENDDERAPAPVRTQGLIALAVLVGFVIFSLASPTPDPLSPAWLTEGIAGLTSRFPRPVSVDTALLALSLTLFLVHSGNAVVQLFLANGSSDTSKFAATPTTPPRMVDVLRPSGRPLLRVRIDTSETRSLPSSTVQPSSHHPDVSATVVTTKFRGGRAIGPLERVLFMVLFLLPALPVVAALMAAKGIVRFPEIAKDGETGHRAEQFLVGSLASWSLSLGAAGLLWMTG